MKEKILGIKREFDLLLNEIDSVNPQLNAELDDIRTELGYEGVRLHGLIDEIMIGQKRIPYPEEITIYTKLDNEISNFNSRSDEERKSIEHFKELKRKIDNLFLKIKEIKTQNE
jgi:hypothetical protein